MHWFEHGLAMQHMPGLSSWQAYACGTPAMVEAARAEFLAICWQPQDQFFVDSFITQAELAAAADLKRFFVGKKGVFDLAVTFYRIPHHPFRACGIFYFTADKPWRWRISHRKADEEDN